MIYLEKRWVENASELSKKELRDKEHSLGRELVKKMLREHFGIESPKILIGENGKPYVENEGVYFNISHSHGLVACVVADTPIGIDVEMIEKKDISLIIGIAKRWFCENEQNYIFDREFSSESFLYVWTRKESLSKLRGLPFAMVAKTDTFSDEANIDTVMDNNYIISIATNI